MSVRAGTHGTGRDGLPARLPRGRAVDRPIFWWSAGGIFFVNAGLSAVADNWVMAILQGLTCLWAGVAGVAAGHAGAGHRRPTEGPPRVSEGAPHSS
jgi:hypothetical protein